LGLKRMQVFSWHWQDSQPPIVQTSLYDFFQ
jgi:hypothetical protein